jgi:hypothetical protein
MFLFLVKEAPMTLPYVTGAELDLGISHAFQEYGCTIMRRNLEMVANRLVYNRDINKMSFPDALRATLNEYKLTCERREWYKAALGKLFSGRNRLMHKGKVPKRSLAKRRHPSQVDKNGQFLLLLS